MSHRKNQTRSAQVAESVAVLDKDAEIRMANILDRADSKVTPEAESLVAELISDIISESPAPLPAEEKPAVESEKPAETPAKLNLRAEMKKLISTGTMSQKDILAELHKMFPHILSATISTILSDSKNAKYAKFEYLTKITEDGKYIWSDQKAPLYKK
jgi:hypothetical protein